MNIERRLDFVMEAARQGIAQRLRGGAERVGFVNLNIQRLGQKQRNAKMPDQQPIHPAEFHDL